MTGFMNDVEKALYTKLATSTALTALLSGGTASPSVYAATAAQGAVCPYVIFAPQSPSTPVRTLGNGVVYENALYTVKAVCDPAGGTAFSTSARAHAGTVADKINTALEGPSLTYTTHTHMRCSRERDVDYTEQAPGGDIIHHRGAVYRINAT